MRLLSFNIRGSLGMDGRRSVERIAQVVEETNADVVCLQEVHRRLPWSGFQDQVRRLERLCGFHVVFQSNLAVRFGSFGNAIATSLPILSCSRHRLSNAHERTRPALRFEHRGLLEVVVETSAGPLAVMTTHWSLDARDWLEAAREVAAHVQKQETSVTLMGDLNALPESTEVGLLRELTGLEDAASSGGEPTYPSDCPRARIDYVLYSPDLGAPRSWVVDTQASDHRPVVVEW